MTDLKAYPNFGVAAVMFSNDAPTSAHVFCTAVSIRQPLYR